MDYKSISTYYASLKLGLNRLLVSVMILLFLFQDYKYLQALAATVSATCILLFKKKPSAIDQRLPQIYSSTWH
jgi:hypothetical protein